MIEPLPTDVRVTTANASLGGRVRDIARYRELLSNLVRKELKVKYKSSVLGFLWSLLNPALYLVVFYVVFSLILGSGIPRFPIYMLSGLLVWNLFLVGLSGATGSVVGNAGLVNKVWFPREILPLSSIGAALVHFFLQSTVLVLGLVIFRHPVGWTYLPLIPLALVALLLVLTGLSLFLSAANVYLRDVQHLLELAMLAWFWLTPVVYEYELVVEKMGTLGWMYRINPVTSVVLAFQRAIYGTYGNVIHNFSFWWYARNLVIVGAIGLVLTALGLRAFGRLEGNFTEEL